MFKLLKLVLIAENVYMQGLCGQGGQGGLTSLTRWGCLWEVLSVWSIEINSKITTILGKETYSFLSLFYYETYLGDKETQGFLHAHNTPSQEGILWI